MSMLDRFITEGMVSIEEMYLGARQYESVISSLSYGDKLKHATRRWKIPEGVLSHQLRCLIGREAAMPQMRLSDTQLRVHSQSAMVHAVRDLWEPLIGSAKGAYQISFADDCGITSDRTPTLRQRVFRRKMYKAMEALELSGIVQTELQGVMNYPQRGLGRLLLLNAHGIVWGDIRRKEMCARVDELNASRSWSNQFGIEPIVLQRFHYGLGDALVCAHYMDKIPEAAKNRMERRKEPGTYFFRDTIRGNRPEFALRVFEGLSHMPILDAVMGIGDGKFVRKAWKARLTEYHRNRPEIDTVTDFLPVDEFWREIRAHNGSKLFEPYQVD